MEDPKSNPVDLALSALLGKLTPGHSPVMAKGTKHQIGINASLVLPTHITVAGLLDVEKVPVQAGASWHVSASTNPNKPGEPITGQAHPKFLASKVTMGNVQTLAMYLQPELVEFTAKSKEIGLKERYVHVKVTATTGAVKAVGQTIPGVTREVWLPPIPLPKLVLPILRSAFMHIHKNFKGSGQGINLTDPDAVAGAALWLMHPDSGIVPSPFPVPNIPSALDQSLAAVKAVSGVVRALVQVGGTFSYLAGLVPLQDSLNSLGQSITTEVGSGIKKLNDYDLVLHNANFLGIETQNDIEAEDEFSALIVTGVPGSEVIFYGDDSYDGNDDGAFAVKVGPGGVTKVSRMDSRFLTTEPAGLFREINRPDDNTWDEVLSSVRFY